MDNTKIGPLFDETLIKEVIEQVISWRRYLHENPELSFQEEKTANYIYETLLSFGGYEVSRPTKTSVLARLIGKKPGNVLAIRADIDALPIQEENEVDYVSKNSGVMHACGHDGHTAMLLGAAKVLASYKDRIEGELRLIFQHAEEYYPGGAAEIMDTGVLDDVDYIIGAHLWTPLRVGKIGIVYGPMMASPDTFWITINGKGGHIGLPHQTVDSIAIGAQVVTNLQHILSRNMDPLENVVVSVTEFHGGLQRNIIPGVTKMGGQVRSFNPELRKTMPNRIEQIVKGITEAHGASYEFEYQNGYKPVINNDTVTKIVEDAAIDLFGTEVVERINPVMAAEDFSGYLQKIPGMFFFIGTGNEEKESTYPHHHPRFNIDEDSLEQGVKMFVHTSLKVLQNK